MAVIYVVTNDAGKAAVPTVVIQPTDYKVVTGANVTALATAVKNEFAAGWCPWGAVAGISSSLYAQALVKY